MQAGLSTTGDYALSEITINTLARRSVDREKVKQLAASIAEIGLLNPVTVSEQQILIAGLHRIEAVRLLGWERVPAVTVPLTGLRAELAEIDENLLRNELSVLDRGESLKRRKEIYETLHPETRKGFGPGRGNKEKKENHFPSFTADTAAKTGVTVQTVRQEVQIASDIASDVKDAIRETPVADCKTDLLLLARMEPEQQRAVAAKITGGAATGVKEATNQLRRVERVERIQQISEGNQPLEGLGVFPVIYADPPWRYEFSADDADAIESHYPSMGIEEICALPVSELAASDAVLFLWATSPKLPEALRVVEAWGFTYTTCMVWRKDKIGLGYYARQQHELLLIAKRGQPPVPEPANRPPSVIDAPRGVHSAKPAEFRALIERMYPEFRKVELFSRAPAEGWTAWGNQA